MSRKSLSKNIKNFKKDIESYWKKYDFSGEFLVHVLQGFSVDSLNNHGVKNLLEFEHKYIISLSSYISKRYEISEANNLQAEDIIKILELHDDPLINTLVDFESTFGHMRKSLRITSVDKIERLNKILGVFEKPLVENQMNNDNNYLEYVMDLPYMLNSNLIKQDLLPNYSSYKIISFNSPIGEHMLVTKPYTDDSSYSMKKAIYLNP